MFVSSNGFDVVGAKHFGFRSLWICRQSTTASLAGSASPAQMYRFLRGNAETLGYQQDYMISTLTDLPGIL